MFVHLIARSTKIRIFEFELKFNNNVLPELLTQINNIFWFICRAIPSSSKLNYHFSFRNHPEPIDLQTELPLLPVESSYQSYD